MSDIFVKILNMSITATYIVAAVLLLRLALKKAPKWSVCMLWCIVAIRLVLPFSLESEISLIPNAEPITVSKSENAEVELNTVTDGIYTQTNDATLSQNKETTQIENVETNEDKADIIVGDTDTADKKEKKSFSMFDVLSVVWLVGIAAMLIYSVVSYAVIRNKVSVCIHHRDNIYFCDNINTSFILGAIKPKIYVPSGTDESYFDYVIQHERAHLKRCDHLLKPFAFLLLSIHWFNPFIWISYILLCRDIEGACDERVIEDENITDIIGYSAALLDCSVNRKMFVACPVSFGEVSVKSRIKSVLKYKRPADWLSAVAVVLSLAVALCFLTNPKVAVNALEQEKELQSTSQNASNETQETQTSDNTSSSDEVTTDKDDKNVSAVQSNNSGSSIQQSIGQGSVATPSGVNVNSDPDSSVGKDDDTAQEQTPSENESQQNTFVYPWPQTFNTTLSTPEYTDRLPQDFKFYRESLGSVQKEMYDKYLPYVLSYTPFYVDFGRATDYQWLKNVIGAIRADYPETAFYFEFSYYDAPVYVHDWDPPYEHCGWSEYFTIDCTRANIENFNQNKVRQYINRMETACDNIIAKMPKSLSTKEKYQWLADSICDMTEYESNYINGTYTSADGPLLYGKGMQEAYPLAYQMLCQRAGLFASTYYTTPFYNVTSWSIIRLDDGLTYYMNLSEADRTNQRSYYYFMTERTL